MTDFALNRLKIERSEWRKNHPFGFVAKPLKNLDGSWNYKVWECRLPGLCNTFWGNCCYHLYMTFSDDYPFRPPVCRFSPKIFHPNVCRNCGTVRTPLLNSHWNPDISIRHILLVIHALLYVPDTVEIANDIAYFLYWDFHFDLNIIDNNGRHMYHCTYATHTVNKLAKKVPMSYLNDVIKVDPIRNTVLYVKLSLREGTGFIIDQ